MSTPPLTRRLRRVLLTVLILFAGAYAIAGVIAYLAQDALIFPRNWAGPALPSAPEGVVRVWIDTPERDRVEGWFLAGVGRSADAPGAAVVFFHGNAELIDTNAGRMRPYVDAGVSVLLVEYRGYGRSGGAPSQRGIVEDSERFLEWLLARPEVDAGRVVYHGRSLGGGIAVQLAARRQPAALVLESTFTSIPALVRRYPLMGALIRHPFRSDRVAPSLRCPVLLLHGDDDALIPPRHSERLAALAPDARLVLLPGGHNDFPRDEAAFWDAVLPFVAQAPRE